MLAVRSFCCGSKLAGSLVKHLLLIEQGLSRQSRGGVSTLEGGCRAGRALGGVAGLTKATSAGGNGRTSPDLSSCLVKKVMERVPGSGACCTSLSVMRHAATSPYTQDQVSAITASKV